MTTMTQASVERTSTRVPVSNGKQLTVEAGNPWPSAYRGSKYSIVSTQRHGDVVQWSHMGDIRAVTHVPDGLQEALRDLGKRNGHGSFKITASGEILTKVPADSYEQTMESPVSRGHVPVYVGMLDGDFDFEEFTNDPATASKGEISVWAGLPFDHGETWIACNDDVLRWNWQDYYFESAFGHSEIVAAYKDLRPVGGRLYINEHGHIWANVDRDEVPTHRKDDVGQAFADWQRSASPAEKRLVNRRLQRTESKSVEGGLLPVNLGHLSQFDDGLVPKPVVEDKAYFNDTSMDPND